MRTKWEYLSLFGFRELQIRISKLPLDTLKEKFPALRSSEVLPGTLIDFGKLDEEQRALAEIELWKLLGDEGWEAFSVWGDTRQLREVFFKRPSTEADV